jgi:hypothetical protein
MMDQFLEREFMQAYINHEDSLSTFIPLSLRSIYFIVFMRFLPQDTRSVFPSDSKSSCVDRTFS